MKKCLAIVVAIVLIVLVCALCACKDSDTITFYIPDGAPALSVAKIVNDKKVGDTSVNTVITTGENVVAKCASGEADMAVLPTNAAVKICQSRNDYLLFSVNVYGVLYIVGTREITSLADLQGETLYSIGLGNTPEYVFKTICDKQGVKYSGDGAIDIMYEADASTINPQILQGKAEFALIGEPAVTNLTNAAKAKGITVYTLFDLQELWQQATDSDAKGYPQASMIVKKSLLTDKFAKELKCVLDANSEFLLANCDRLNDLMKEAHSTLDVNYTVDILNRCNLTVISAQDAKADIKKYLSTFGITNISDSIYYETEN